MTKVYKLEVMVIDHDGVGPDEMKIILENARYPNHCMSPVVTGSEVREVEWTDDHPINMVAGQEQALKALFSNSEGWMTCPTCKGQFLNAHETGYCSSECQEADDG